MRRYRTVMTFSAIGLLASVGVYAGANWDAEAWLSWDSTRIVCDLTVMPIEPTPIYVQLNGLVQTTGCEIYLLWLPPGPPETGCYEFLSGTHPSGQGDDCLWVMRGDQVEGANVCSENREWYVAFQSEVCSTCETGNVARMLIDFGSCGGDVPGQLCLAAVRLYDCAAEMDVANCIGSATVLGGVGVECPCGDWDRCPGCDNLTSASRTTWGAIKALY